jgi:ABC-type dipeptide/oligopeptide/nickel transport system ATPase subunit
MITIKDLRLNDAKNRPYLTLDGQISLKENTIYFVIGHSGVGKTSIVDFLANPLTEDPIKNGIIELSGDIRLEGTLGKKASNIITVKDSLSRQSGDYYRFIRKTAAIIPQKTDSFHPSIPLRRQLYRSYKMALPKGKRPDMAEFKQWLEELGPCAGWEKVSFSEKNNDAITIADDKKYIDQSGEQYEIVKVKDDDKVYESELSTGQLQRLLILQGLIQFKAAKNPILIGDEFLVNFTWIEAGNVLRGIMDYFAKSKEKHKIGIFILHDLSFSVLRNLPANLEVKLIGIDSQKQDNGGPKVIKAYEMNLCDFFEKKWNNAEEAEFFEEFRESYDVKPLGCQSKNFLPDSDVYPYPIDVKRSPSGRKKIYGPIHLEIGKHKFIVITGFSGCGKTTLCTQYIHECIKDKMSFRYFPSLSLSYISNDSQTKVRHDLEIMYSFYNHIYSLDNENSRKLIDQALQKVQFDNVSASAFLERRIFDLSGGQQQRYWLARLLFETEVKNTPGLFIFDESIASLDCITKNKIIPLLLDLLGGKEGASVLFVSHDLRDIGVIYETVKQLAGEKNAADIFEHYEMFNGGLYRVKTDFDDYRTNLQNSTANVYIDPSSKNEIYLKLSEAAQ